MRMLICLLALGLAGCAQTTLKSPVDGATVTCGPSVLPDFNLWTGYQLCLESAVTEGYQRVP
jgi:hypothetical protein